MGEQGRQGIDMWILVHGDGNSSKCSSDTGLVVACYILYVDTPNAAHIEEKQPGAQTVVHSLTTGSKVNKAEELEFPENPQNVKRLTI